MRVPALSSRDRRSLKLIESLEDEDLYAMIGSPASYDQISSTADFLLVGFRFEKTKEAIARGKRRLRGIMGSIRDATCKQWESIKKREIGLDKKTIIAIIAGAIKGLDLDSSVPVIPAAVLICRICTYSLDAFCKKKTVEKRL